MTRSFSNRLFGGVCGGLAAAIPLNAWIWRLIFVLLTVLTGGAAAMAYLLLWWLMPLESPLRRGGGSITSLLGLLLGILLIGLWFARSAIGLESLYWPLAVLVLAAVFLLKQIFSGAWENIALGVVAMLVPLGFLLHNLNALQAGYADILLRAWPAVLIFLGLVIALRYRMRFGSWLALIGSVVLVAALASFAYSSRVDALRDEQQLLVTVPNSEDNSLNAISPTITTLIVDVSSLDTDVSIGLNSTAERSISVDFKGSLNSDIDLSYSEDGAIAVFVLEENQASEFPRLEDIGRGNLSLGIPPNIAVLVRFEGASGTTNFDMAALNLEELTISLAEGNAIVSLPSYQPVSPTVAGGNLWHLENGDLLVRVPDDLGLRFSLSEALHSRPAEGTNFDALDFQLLFETGDYVVQSRQFESDETLFRMSYRVEVPSGSFRVESSE